MGGCPRKNEVMIREKKHGRKKKTKPYPAPNTFVHLSILVTNLAREGNQLTHNELS